MVLGCTHYPYLIPQIKQIVGDAIQIIDSGEAVAHQTKSVLIKNELLHHQQQKGSHQFYSNQDKKILERIIKMDNNKSIEIIEKDF